MKQEEGGIRGIVVRHDARRRFLGAALGLMMTAGIAAAPARAAEEAKDPDEGEYVTFADDHPLGEIKPDQALLYVVRPTSIGFAIKSFSFVDNTIVGINRGSSYFFVDVTPGKHILWSKSENVDALEVTFEAGKTYYLQQQVQLGGFRARTKLKMLDATEGPAALAKCKKHGTMGLAGVAKGMHYAATLKANVQEDLDRRAKEAEEGAEEKKDSSRVPKPYRRARMPPERGAVPWPIL